MVLKVLQCFSHNSENILVAWKYSSYNSESILGAWCRESLYCWKYSGLCYCRQSLVLWTSAHRNHVTSSTLIDMEHCWSQPRCFLTLPHKNFFWYGASWIPSYQKIRSYRCQEILHAVNAENGHLDWPENILNLFVGKKEEKRNHRKRNNG